MTKLTILDIRDFIVLLITIVLFNACEKPDHGPGNASASTNEIPADTGGIHYAYILDTAQGGFGHYMYIPGGYQRSGANYPLLIFLHGAGERGNSAEDSSALDLLLRNGPPMLIERDEWNPVNPMLVVSPQCHNGWWNAQELHEFIAYIISEYNINEQRIYLTGLSMGGFGTFSYLQTYSDSGYVVAAVPICGSGDVSKAEALAGIPIWAFHGDADNTVAPSGSINVIEAINALNPQLRGKLTIYPGVGHNSWSRTYDGSGMGTESIEYDSFDQSIYDWMYQYTKSGGSSFTRKD